ncbi:DUF4177 domain-containing protein [Roseibaca sp. Y0-43]|uniref:DUF4177 domain-containing protein n=1 Tax=Roseibaca sp. Y0-43 TaxID=2816854 RepID=UPI001D0C953F|nr:DUF4177 domain-containing protein [Roseibaca sp. Y0-43]MCC1481237.1 DUF4177 domain-containing protein [Roseibaca sp. Y0-43]
MERYEYLAVPAPGKGMKVKGLKTASDRYAHQLTLLLNDLAAEGWEYWRADTLASEERKGLTGTTRVSHELLIFRRLNADALAAQMPQESYDDSQDAPEQAYATTGERTEPQLGSSERYYEDTGPRLSAPSRD